MRKSRLWLTASAGVLAIALACHVDGPMSPIVPVPIRMSGLAAAPVPQVYTLSSQAGSSVELTGNNYPYNTWITVVPDGPEFMLTAYGPAQPPTGLVGATGVAGGHDGCALNAMLKYGGVSTWFGPCGGTVGTDTVLAKQQWFIQQGPMPLDYPAQDCPPHPVTCHTQEIVPTTFTVSPIPALMVPVTAVPRTVQFSSVQYQQVTLTTGADPAQIFVGGSINAMPVITTSWVYTAADGTPDGNMCSGGFSYLYCQPYLHKAGRLVVKGFIGGWEQSSTVTVQCLTPIPDSVLNDTTNDFQVRSALLKMLDSAHPEVAPGFGYDPVKGRGVMHEIDGNIWKLPNGGGYMLVPYDSPGNTECTADIDTVSPPPVSGAVLYGHAHTHQTPWDKPIYGCPKQVVGNGQAIEYSKFPDDTANGKRPIIKNRKDFENGGSGQDWWVALMHLPPRPSYVIDADGTVAEISYFTKVIGHGRIHNWAPTTAGPCAWVR